MRRAIRASLLGSHKGEKLLVTLEPSWSLPIVLIAGLAGMYVWYLLSEATIFDRVFAYPREHWGALWGCPFCAGFWIVGLLLAVTGTYDPVTHLAATAVCGVVGKNGV